MTLLFMDSFDHYAAADVLRKWTSMTGVATMLTGRFGGSCVRLTSANCIMHKTLTGSHQTLIWGAAVKFSAFPGQYGHVIRFTEGGYTDTYLQCGVRHSVTPGLFTLNGGSGAVLAESVIPLYANVWYYFELKAYIHNSLGTMELRVNNTTYASASNVDTQKTANANADGFGIGEYYNFASGTYYDDMYICNGAGGVNDDFLGDHRVECLFPSGAGNYAQWTPNGAANNYDCVNDAAPNGDTDYNSQDGAGLPKIDSFAMSNLESTTGTIKGVQSVLYHRKDDAGDVTVAPLYRIGGTDYPQTGVNLPDTYQYGMEVEEVSPATATAFSIAEVNGLEFGYKRTA